MVRMTAVCRSRPVRVSFLFIVVVGAFVLGGLGIPIVSSEGMIIRAQLISGDVPITPEDPAWQKIPPMTLPRKNCRIP